MANGRLLLVKASVPAAVRTIASPPLGLAALAAVARERCGFDVSILDTYLESDPEAALDAALRRFEPTVIGLSGLTAERASLAALAERARRACPAAPILIGGPHASADPMDALTFGSPDAVITGEGEATLVEVLGRLASREPLDGTAGAVIRGGDGSPVLGPERPFIEDLDSLPFPAWDLLAIDRYATLQGMTCVGLRRYMLLFTSRGCPYRCNYCHDIQGKRFRGASPEYVLGMIDRLVNDFDVHDFDVVDDIFNWDGPRMERILDGMAARFPGVRFTLPNGVRCDRLDAAQVDKLARAGCEHLCLAFETASPRLQRWTRKHLKIDRVVEVARLAEQRRVFTTGFFMLGFPTETEAEMRATIALAARSRLHTAMFFTVTPYAGTGLRDSVDEQRLATFTDLDRHTARQFSNLSLVPDRTFASLRAQAYLRFYGDPRRMWRILRDLPRFNMLASCLRNLAAIFVRSLATAVERSMRIAGGGTLPLPAKQSAFG